MSNVLQLGPIKAGLAQLLRLENNNWTVQVPDSVTVDQLTDKSLWTNIANKLVSGDEIRVLNDSMSYRVLLLVTYVNGFDTLMKQISYTKLDDVSVSLTNSQAQEYTIANKGQLKWCVQRIADGERIATKLASKLDAVRWLDDYLLALSR